MVMIRSLPLALVVVVGLAGPALAVFPPPIKDDGKFFTKEGVEKANKKIRDIYEKYRKDVVIETITSLSEEQEKKFKEEGEAKFFPRLALQRIHDLGVNGVYVLISKKPRRVQIEMDTPTRKSAFTNADRSKALKRFIDYFKKEEFDAGLLAALDTIEASLKANSK
jgi:uncharacterized membrane protein YgcG